MTRSLPLESQWCLEAAEPAAEWVSMFPLGDGTLGAMCDGGLPTARFFLNHELGWSGHAGSERPADAQAAQDALAAARDALARDNAAEATRHVQRLQSDYTQAFQPVGVVEIDQPGKGEKSYRRVLDLRRGLHQVHVNDHAVATTLTQDGTLIHLTDSPVTDVRVLVPHVEESREAGPGELAVSFRFPSDAPPPHEPEAGGPVWSGDGMPAVVFARWGDLSDGRAFALVTVEVGFALDDLPPTFDDLTNRATQRLDRVSATLDDVVAAHEREHSNAMLRAGLDLTPAAPEAELTSDAPAFAALAFNYGRYLLYSCCGWLPPTLQGLWSVDVQPPWSSNYTTNINLEMAHWPVGAANVSEGVRPLVELLGRVAEHGRDTARDLYGLPGWVCHHNTDAWAYSNPVGCGRGDPSWAQWVFGGAWPAFELVDFVRLGVTDDELDRRIWPIVRGACEFCLGWLRRDDGRWVTSPATSPENLYIDDDGRAMALDVVTASDLAIIWQLASATVWLAGHLELGDDPVVVAATHLLAELPSAPDISSTGELVEWSRERPPVEVHHRHLSHLIGLYPGHQPWDEAHRAAAVRTLEVRGDEGTSWSLAWKLCLWARLRRPDKVVDLLSLALRPCQVDGVVRRSGLYPNLLSAHPPFQLDGNLGLVAGIAEVLMQSHEDAIDLLPALPATWPSGRVWGLRARPGVGVDISWEDGRLSSATLTAPRAVRVSCRYEGQTLAVDLEAGVALDLTGSDFDV